MKSHHKTSLKMNVTVTIRGSGKGTDSMGRQKGKNDCPRKDRPKRGWVSQLPEQLLKNEA